MVKAVPERVKRNPKRFIQKSAKDINVSNTLMRTVIRNDLIVSPQYEKMLRPHSSSKTEDLTEQSFFSRELKAGMTVDETIFSEKKSSLSKPSSTVRMKKVLAKCPENIPDFWKQFIIVKNNPLSWCGLQS